MPLSPLQLVKWSNELAASLGKPEAAKFVYDWVKASGGVIPSADDVARLSRAVDQGFNTVGYRYSANPTKDEKHLQKMLLEPERLADESRAFHVDITPGHPAASRRAFNTLHDPEVFDKVRSYIRPLALRLDAIDSSDDLANTTSFLNKASKQGKTGVRYSPTNGELSFTEYDDVAPAYRFASSPNYQPSVAMVDPTAVRDLRSAKFTPRTKAALTAAVAAGTTPLLQAEERTPTANQEQMTHKKFVPGANPLVQIPRGFVAGTASLAREGEDLARLFAKYISAPGSMAENWGNRESVLPTNKFFRDVLPFKDEGVGADELQTLGGLAGGVGLPSLAKLTAKYAPKIALAAAEAGPVGRSAQRGIIKKPGGNWLSGSIDDSLKGLKSRVRTEGINGHTAENAATDTALNEWIDRKLAKYVKNDMATEDDPIRALAERGVLHVDPGALNFRPEMHGKLLLEGQTAVAQSPAARAWEGVSDDAISVGKVKDFVGNSNFPKDQEWLAKAAPDAQASWVPGAKNSGLPQDLGFDHLIDELRNATNPTSGLPADLLWKYSDLNKVTVPQAVERVARINAWREAQKVEANAAKANNAATVLHKDYPDKGFKWVELKKGEELPEGWTQRQKPGSSQTEWLDPHGRLTEDNLDPRYAALRDALRYEGDTMGNCVGGYCDKVAGGQSRVFSLRDSKGQPHVTIETQRGDGWDRVQNDNAFAEEFYKYLESKGLGDDYANGMFDDEAVNKLALEFTKNNSVDSISQIKGSGKKDSAQRIRMANTGYADNPDAHLLPYIQDFVKSGKWSSVRDLDHAGLLPRKALTQAEQGLAPELGDYLTMEQIQELRKGKPWTPIDTDPDLGELNFAAGGSVSTNEYDPARVDALVAQLKEEMYG